MGQATIMDSNCVRDARKGITEETKSQRLSAPRELFIAVCGVFLFVFFTFGQKERICLNSESAKIS